MGGGAAILTYSELWSVQEPILAMAAIVEIYFRFSGGVQSWRAATANWWYNLQMIRWPNRREISLRFYEIFVVIYGDRMFSGRRLVASAISSILFVLITYWFLVNLGQAFFDLPITAVKKGIQPPWLDWIASPGQIIRYLELRDLTLIIYDSLGVNLVPDMISLAETGWLIKMAGTGKRSLTALFFLDLLLTSLIWMTAHGIAHVGTVVLVRPIDLSLVYSFTNSAWVAYIISTYATSILWLSFILAVLIVSTAKRTSQLAAVILESRWVSEIPIALIVGIPCLLSWLVLFILRIFSGP